MKTRTRSITVTGLLLALGIILPFATAHGFGVAGTVLLPMHLPVFLCGLLCGPLYGTVCGLLLPMLNSLLTGMPAPVPMMPLMMCELAVYGAISGFLYRKTRLGRFRGGIYPVLIVAMVCGRIAYGLGFHLLLLIGPQWKMLTVWAAILTGLPGILLQLILIPALMLFIKRESKGKK